MNFRSTLPDGCPIKKGISLLDNGNHRKVCFTCVQYWRCKHIKGLSAENKNKLVKYTKEYYDTLDLDN